MTHPPLPDYRRYPAPEEEPLTDQEIEIVKTALSILPHLGPEATTAYLDRASHHQRNEHEEH